MSDLEVTTTALALAGAALTLQQATLNLLIEKGVIQASDALAAVQKLRQELEAPNKTGGVRASMYLEPLEDQLQARMRD